MHACTLLTKNQTQKCCAKCKSFGGDARPKTLHVILDSWCIHAYMQQVTLVEGHVSYEQLQSPSLPMYKSLYFFNLTNPDNFEAGTAKPQLQEIGPYSYK